jgi:hypothetical protein
MEIYSDHAGRKADDGDALVGELVVTQDTVVVMVS